MKTRPFDTLAYGLATAAVITVIVIAVCGAATIATAALNACPPEARGPAR